MSRYPASGATRQVAVLQVAWGGGKKRRKKKQRKREKKETEFKLNYMKRNEKGNEMNKRKE